MGGAKRVSDESPPPPEVILPVIQTPEVMKLTEKGEKTGTPVRNQKKTSWKSKMKARYIYLQFIYNMYNINRHILNPFPSHLKTACFEKLVNNKGKLFNT